MEKLAIITFMLCVLVFLLTVLDFAALHDIRRDYVSRFILDHLDMRLSGELPSWTGTPGEWRIVTASLSVRLIFLIPNMVVLAYVIRKSLKEKNVTRQIS